MKSLFGLLGAMLLISLTGCGVGSSSSNHDTLALFSSSFAIPHGDFDLAAVSLNGLVYFTVSEADQGFSDLNADGDAADLVVHVLDPQTGTVTNLGISVRAPIRVSSSFVYWVFSELDEGSVDANGDSDINDLLLAVYDPTQPMSATNPSKTTIQPGPFSAFVSWNDTVVFATDEAAAGADFNGDFDTSDYVVRAANLATQTVTLESAHSWSSTASGFSIGNGIVAWLMDEMEQGDQDFNGDTDTSDTVIMAADLTTNTVFRVGVGGLARAAAPFIPAIMGTVANPVIPYAINEANEFGSSANFSAFGDTDSSDSVLALYDVTSGIETLPFGGIAIDPLQTTGNATRCAFVASESANSPTGAPADFNQDGDTDDEVPFWLDLSAPATPFSLGVASPTGDARVNLCDDYLLFLASEADNDTNYNPGSGDTDTSDDVTFFVNVASVGSVSIVNTGMATNAIACFEGEQTFFLLVDEGNQGGMDLNGDEAADDISPIYFTVGPNGPVQGPLGVKTDGPVSFQVCPLEIRVFANASETNLGDINRDGDEDDYVLRATRLRRDTGFITVETEIHTMDTDGTSFPLVVDMETIVYPFAESMFGPGLDANGDGDTGDIILNYVNAFCL